MIFAAGAAVVPAVFVTPLRQSLPALREQNKSRIRKSPLLREPAGPGRNGRKDTIMRLDKYLKVSRLIKRRTVANEVADAGRILINGKVAKASQAVKAGDLIEVTFGNRPIKVRVLSDVEPRTKDVAREMYEILSE